MGFIARKWEGQTWDHHLEQIWGHYFETEKGLKNFKRILKTYLKQFKILFRIVTLFWIYGHLKWLFSKNLAGLDKQASDQIMKSAYLWHLHMLLSYF